MFYRFIIEFSTSWKTLKSLEGLFRLAQIMAKPRNTHIWSLVSNESSFLIFTLSGFASKWITISGAISSLLGILGIYSSVMVYADTPRPSWNFKLTCLRFFSTTLGVGIALSGWFFLAAIPMFISLSIDIIIMAGKNSNCIHSGRLMRGPLKNLS